MTVYVLKYSVCELIMEVDQGQNEKKKKKSVGECKIELWGLETVGAVPECESGVLTVTGALRLHDTWHVSSPNASRSPPPATTVLQLRTPRLHTEIEMTMCGKEKELYRTRGLDMGCVREETGKAAVLPRIYPYRWCKDDPKSITSQLYVPGPGLGLGTHSWTAVLNPQRGTNRKFENRIHTWVTLEGFGWINELSGSLSTCWGSAILYQLVSF